MNYFSKTENSKILEAYFFASTNECSIIRVLEAEIVATLAIMGALQMPIQLLQLDLP